MTLPPARTLVIAAVVVVVVIGLGLGGWFWVDARERRALSAHAVVMTRAQAALSGQSTPDERAVAIRDIERLLAEHPSAATVPHAAYELGNLRYAGREYAAARAAYEIALNRGAADTIRAMTRASIGFTWEAEGNLAQARDAFAALAEDLQPGEFLWEDTMIDLARVQENAGEQDAAVETYRRLLKEAPGARREDFVRSRLAALGVAAED
jgi:tetratricopeptide (TPR) repeat protein